MTGHVKADDGARHHSRPYAPRRAPVVRRHAAGALPLGVTR